MDDCARGLLGELTMRIASIFLLSCAALLGQVRVPGPGGSTTSIGGGGNCTPASGYSYCRELTIDHTQVGGSALSDFAVLVKSTLGSSRIQSANCYDVIFTSDSAGSAKIPWEMESCTPVSGAIIAWAGLSAISASTNTNFYVSYGNPSISAPQNTGSYAPANVWDSSYVAVYHLPNGSSLSLNDSTANGYNATMVGAVSAGSGQVDGDASFSGATGAYLNTGILATAFLSNTLTASCWMYSMTGGVNGAFSNNDYDNTGSEHTTVEFLVNSGPDYWARVNTSGGQSTASGGSFSINSWTYVVVVYNGSTLSVYGNGSVVATASASGFFASDSVAIQLGRRGNSTNYGTGAWPWYGGLDECRFSNSARPSNWVTAEYNNQISGSTFVNVGAEY